ncbi:MAG TPA: hypothetical protein VF981_13620 [Gemmatimonadaceae bacterium]
MDAREQAVERMSVEAVLFEDARGQFLRDEAIRPWLDAVEKWRAAILEVLQAERRRALERCFGQRDSDGDALLFVVRVKGIGARAASPMEVAHTLARAWSGQTIEEYPVAATVEVTVADDLLAELPEAPHGHREGAEGPSTPSDNGV